MRQRWDCVCGERKHRLLIATKKRNSCRFVLLRLHHFVKQSIYMMVLGQVVRYYKWIGIKNFKSYFSSRVILYIHCHTKNRLNMKPRLNLKMIIIRSSHYDNAFKLDTHLCCWKLRSLWNVPAMEALPALFCSRTNSPSSCPCRPWNMVVWNPNNLAMPHRVWHDSKRISLHSSQLNISRLLSGESEYLSIQNPYPWINKHVM